MGTETTCIDGTEISFKGEFFALNVSPPAPEDPDRVAFTFGVVGGEATTYTYGVNAELVRDSAGNYHVDVDTTGMAPEGDKAYLIGEFIGASDGMSTLQVVGDVTVLVLAPPLPNPFI